MFHLNQVLFVGLALVACTLGGKQGEADTQQASEYAQKNNDRYNELLRKYLGEFVRFQQTQPEDDRHVMDTVKLMIIQSWLYSLSADRNLVNDFITVDEPNLDDTRQRIADIIKQKTGAQVAEDFITYSENIAGKLKTTFENDMTSYSNQLESLENIIADEADETKREALVAQRNVLIEKHNEAEILMTVHETANKMATQTYFMNFMGTPTSESFVMSGHTKEITCAVPTLRPGDFEGFVDPDDDED